MAVTPSQMIPLGTEAPSFDLTDPRGGRTTLDDLAEAPALLVAFWCNHCPFVKHIRQGFVDFVNEYGPRGLALVAINSNDAETHPQDSPEQMVHEAETHGFPFPYLVDDTQEVARAYDAACTPDFFLFDGDRKLVYRGQFDGARPGNSVPVSGDDLARAVDAVLDGQAPDGDQVPSIGCNIKWKASSG